MKTSNNIVRLMGLLLLAWLLPATALQAESLAEKAKALRSANLEYLIGIEVPIINFGTDENKNKYHELKTRFASNLAFYLEGDYAEAYQSYTEIQKDVEKLYEDISLIYIERTQEMLTSFNREIIDLESKYAAGSETANRFSADRASYYDSGVKKEKLNDQIFDPKEYHLFYDKPAIINALQIGYQQLGDAKRTRLRAMEFEKHLVPGAKIDPRLRDLRIQYYKGAIELCRTAKRNAVTAFQLRNRTDIYSIQSDAIYDAEKKTLTENRWLAEYRLDPVFDPRIPDKYKVDATDAIGKNYELEKQVKVELKNPAELDKKSATEEPAASKQGS